MKATSAACFLACAALSVVIAGCAEIANGADPHELKQQLCTEADLGGHYVEKTSGTFSIDNLASLSDNPSARENALKASGAEGGQFAYWVHTVPNPPFNPPLEVVCQVMAFHTAAEASAYVHNLRGTPDELASAAIAWVPEGKRQVKELDISGGEPAVASSSVMRAFRIEAHGAAGMFAIYAVIESDGQYVRTTYLGNNGNAGTLQLALKIAAATASRVHQS